MDEDVDPASTLLDFHHQDPEKSVADTYQAAVITSSPFLQADTVLPVPASPRTPLRSPDFATLRHRLAAMSGSASTPISGTAQTGPVPTPAAAIAELKLLLNAGPEEAFGDKAAALRSALNGLLATPSVAVDTKDSLQAFLARLESNCSALKTHKPKVDRYRTLRTSMDSYTYNAHNLLSRLDRLEAEYNALVATAADLQTQLSSNLDRQDAIIAEQGGLASPDSSLSFRTPSQPVLPDRGPRAI